MRTVEGNQLTSTLKLLAATSVLLSFVTPVFAQDEGKTAHQDHEETLVLFDGSNLDQWRGYRDEATGEGWKIEDGILKFDGSGGGDIVTREEFANFDLSFEWAVTPGANSGVMYRAGMGDPAPYFTAPEYQILDNDRHADGKNKLTSAAAIYGLYASDKGQPKPVGEWNSGRIVVNGNRVEHWLNGTLVVEAEFGSEDWNKRIANSKFREWEKFATLASGRIALQDHGDEVWYRNIKIRRIAPASDDK